MHFFRQPASQVLARSIGASLTVGVLLLITACGQKGSLYRPDEKAQEVASPAGDATTSGKKKSTPVFPAPQSQKEDRPAGSTPTETATQPAAPDPDRPAAPPPPGGN
jgi:predicted small lipoprotein YifL